MLKATATLAAIAAAVTLAPAAMAQEAPRTAKPSEAAIEAAAAAFEARMETFGARVETISADASLSEGQKGERIAAVWAEYQPEVMAFTAAIAEQAATIAAEALAEVDVSAITAAAAEEAAAATAEASAAVSGPMGMVQNGAWASNDPEHMETYGLVAQYALGQVEDAVAVEVEAIQAEAEAIAAAEAADPEATRPDAD